MAKRIKTKYTGVFYREAITNGKIDKIYYIIFKENGETKEVKVGKLSEGIRANYANNIRNSTINSLRLGNDLPTLLVKAHKAEVITFDQIAMKYFDSRELLNRTNHQARSKYKSQLHPLIGDKNISKLTKNDILDIQIEFAKTRAPKTVNQYIQFIRAVYNFATEEEIYDGKNPTKGIKEQKVDNKRERFLTVDDIKLLLNDVKEEPSTIMSISKKDIDFENNMVILQDLKNNDTYGGFFNGKIGSLLLAQVQNLKANDTIISMNERTLRRRMSIILTKLFNQLLFGVLKTIHLLKMSSMTKCGLPLRIKAGSQRQKY